MKKEEYESMTISQKHVYDKLIKEAKSDNLGILLLKINAAIGILIFCWVVYDIFFHCV